MKEVDAFAVKAKTWDNNPVRMNMADQFVSKIFERGNPLQSRVVIEIGCGTGLVGLNFKDSACHLIMVDVSESMLRVLREKIGEPTHNISVVHGEIGEISGRVKADLIIAFMSLHHMEDTEHFFKQAHDRLSEGGMLVIGDVETEDGSFHAENPVPHNGFDVAELSIKAQKIGYKETHHESLMTIEKGGRFYNLFFMTLGK